MGTYDFKLVEEKAELRDGDRLVAVIVCVQSTYDSDMALIRLETEADIANKEDIAKIAASSGEEGEPKLSDEMIKWHYFRARIYPKMAASAHVEGGQPIPTAEEAYKIPSAQLNKWYKAASIVNPGWFDEFRQLTEAAIKMIEELPSKDPQYQRLKKKGKKQGE